MDENQFGVAKTEIVDTNTLYEPGPRESIPDFEHLSSEAPDCD